MNKEYNLEKWIWSESDFVHMNWHDCQIHAFAFAKETFELVFDLDYTIEWVHHPADTTQTKVWVAPATLVFENVYNIEFDIASEGDLEISSIRQGSPRTPRNALYIHRESEWTWDIECQQGDIKLTSVGYKQYIRALPQLYHKQKIDLFSRGGYSFARKRTDI